MNETLNDFGITHYELLNSGGERWRFDPNFLSPAAIERMQAPLDPCVLDEIEQGIAYASYLARWKATIKRRFKK
jgi:hypothetical protein